MSTVTIVYWRDIPAQVIVGKGRRAAKVQLPERFEKAIDRAAMKTGLIGTDSYLTEWRRGESFEVSGEDEAVAIEQAKLLDSEYDDARLKELVETGGRAS
ncbi:MAG: virulence factor [Maritimibacter sp.]|jgi:hypothetical protein